MDSVTKIAKDKILQNTVTSTEFYDVAEPHKVLPELCVRVYPQLEQVDFYGGHSIPEFDYVPASSRAQRELWKQRESNWIIKHCELSDLLHHFERGQLTFTGQAGSGKSTLLKAIARAVIVGKYGGLRDVEIVHFIRCHNFRQGDKITLGELLFQNTNPKLSDEEIKQTLEYAATNPNRFLFILDSLDTLSYTIDGLYRRLCVTDRASPDAVLWNFLAGKLIPGCRVITSSREHSIRNYNREVRAQKVIALVGFSMDSIRKIVVGYVGEKEAEEIMQYMEHKSPTLLDLSTTPVFLSYNLVGFKCGDDFKPSTMSGILVLLLNSLIRSPHAHVENILEVIHKLEELSFTGTKERRVLFSTEEFVRFGLEPQAVTDLAILAPGGLTQRLLLGLDLMFFAHQSIQELLTAMYIAQMPRELFLNFLRYSIHTAHYAVVRRILCGLLLDDEVKDQAEQYFQGNLNVKGNQDLLRQSLLEQLSQSRDRADTLELYLSLSEAKNGMNDTINSSIKEIDLGRVPLSPSDAHAVGWVASNCKQLCKLSLWDCHLTSASANALVLNLWHCDLKISTLDLSENTNMGVAGLKSLGEISKQTKVDNLDLHQCDLSSQELQALKDGLGSAKLSTLDLSNNTNMGVAGLKSVGEISEQCRVEKLDLEWCNLSSQELLSLKEGLDSTKLSTLNLCENTTMGEEGLKTVGEISKQCRVEELDLIQCELSSQKLQALKDGLDSAKLSTFNLRENTAVDEEGFKTVGEISKQCRVEELNLTECELSSQELQALKEGLGPAKLKKLSLGSGWVEKRTASHEDILVLSELIQNVTESLDLNWWRIHEEDEGHLQRQLDRCYPTRLEIETENGALSANWQMEPDQRQATEGEDAEKEEKEEEDEEAEQEGVKASETWSGKVTSDGMELSIGGCFISFPDGAFDVTTDVRAKVEIDSSKWPRGYIGITPMLYVESGRRLQKPASVRMTSWCMNSDDDGGETARVHVLHRPQGSQTWEISARLPFKDETVFHFETYDFSPFLVGILERLFGPQIFLIDGFVYATFKNIITFGFCLQHELIKDALKKDLKESKKLLVIDPVDMRKGDEIQLSLKCCCATQSQPDPQQHSFKVDDAFIRLRKKITLRSQLINEVSAASPTIQMKCGIRKNHNVIDDNMFFTYVESSLKRDDDAPRMYIAAAQNVVSGNSQMTYRAGGCQTQVTGTIAPEQRPSTPCTSHIRNPFEPPTGHAAPVVEHHYHDHRTITANTAILDQARGTTSYRNSQAAVTASEARSVMVRDRNQYTINFVYVVFVAILGIVIYSMLP